MSLMESTDILNKIEKVKERKIDVKALIHEKTVGIKGLKLKEVETKEVGKKEIRIKVKTIGLNHRDLATVKGRNNMS